MGKYLKLFDTTSQYNAYTADTENFILPNVSLAKDAPTTVHYHPYVAPDPYNGHEYVDLGLPSGTKWAKMNVGAASETAYGNYYQYGKGSAQYAATSGDPTYEGTENPLATSADTAAQVMGGQWHIPTSTQYEELTANTTIEWTTSGGINGYKFTATNGNYVFFPAAGWWSSDNQYDVSSNGRYWSSSSYANTHAYDLEFNSGGVYVDFSAFNRQDGYSVRGVVG